MISDRQLSASAVFLGVSIAHIKAVADVESRGSGFLASGEPVILFEPHIFWKELIAKRLNPHDFTKGNEDILYPKWGHKPYGKVGEQHDRLKRASAINREAALKSASWGKFQILGLNYSLCDCESLQEFINAMYANEDAQLRLFASFIKKTHLDAPLRNGDWETFALRYNGSQYKKNSYHIKLEHAYRKFKNQKIDI